MEFQTLRSRLAEYLPAEKLQIVEEAYAFAATAHGEQLRRSGEPYIQHPLETAAILIDLQLDVSAIAAALLHDVPEDCGVPISEIEARFGPEIAKLVDGATKLTKIAYNARGRRERTTADEDEAQAENLRKMLLAMAEDVRVVLIKLADRLHNMLTLSALPPAKRRTIAQETMEIFAPLANRLGIWQVKWQLEDLSFRYLDPDKYREVARLIASRRVAREKYIEQVIAILRAELAKAGVKAEVAGRPKHIYSVYRKMEKYALQGKDFAQIYDLLAVRVLVNEVQDCYSALGVLHGLWHPLPGQFDDYIAMPKESMYQSLHTTVIGPSGQPLEVQIRTHEMHRIAEYGIAAHWRYKEGGKREDADFAQKVAWLRQLMEWQKELVGAQEFVESVKTDIFQDRVFVYTPKGDIKDLPAGSTPLDFAYRIHTDLGHRCVGAKVNGRLVALDYQLRNGDIVEILSSKAAKGPSRDWLNPNLGYVRTSHGRDKIRQWFKRQERAENIERGREMVEKELKRLGVEVAIEEIARLFRYDKLEDFLAGVGYGEVTTHQIALRLDAQEEKPLVLPSAAPKPSASSSAVQVMGAGGLLTQLARCCTPVPGDDIVGYITRSKGVSVHRRDCANIANEDEKERLITVQWGRTEEQLYPVSVKIDAWDRVGLLRDISTVVSEEKVNMSSVSTVTYPDQTAVVRVTLETRGISQLSRVLSKLEGVRGVVNVARDVGASRAST